MNFESVSETVSLAIADSTSAIVALAVAIKSPPMSS